VLKSFRLTSRGSGGTPEEDRLRTAEFIKLQENHSQKSIFRRWASRLECFVRPTDSFFLASFFLSAALYLTAIGAVFAPCPLLLIFFKRGRVWAFIAAITNAALVLYLGGKLGLAVYLISILLLFWIVAELLKRNVSVEKAVLFALGSVLMFTGVGLVLFSQIYHLDWMGEFYHQMLGWVKQTGRPVIADSKFFNPGDFEEWKHSFVVEFLPSVSVSLLILVWANLTLLLRSNPAGLRERLGLDAGFEKKWKAPELLIWPTLLSGFFIVFDFGLVSELSLVVFEFFMAVYAIQGLSILSYLFDLWGVRGLFRVFGYSLCVLLMLPPLLSLGFFDLWFDFRGKFRQT
jgi:hypothetical protein